MPSFNQFMHARNPYRERPDFADLAAQYPALQPFLIPCVHRNDRVTIDFGNPEALRSLTQALFKCHWGLDVELPRDRLIPAIPQRLNYILWLEDLINDLIDINYEGNKRECIRGIDIGTGASCVFPLVICRRNPSWHMLALESDAISAQVALRNLTANQLAERISLVNSSDCLSHLRREKVSDKDASSVETVNTPHHFHFTICNPPFFVSKRLTRHVDVEDEIQIEEQDDCDGISDYNDESKSSLCDATVTCQATRARESGERRTHKSQRCKSSGNTSCDKDSITHGGEVEFVRRLIAQSAEMADSIDLFTVMLGSKESLIALKRELNRLKEENDRVTFNWTLFCQGRVIRWGLVWSFTRNLHSSSVERICSHKLPKKSSEWTAHLPAHATPPGLDEVTAWTDLLVDILIHSLDIKTFHIIKSTPHTSVIIIRSNVNTWSHQRRKRRQLQREQDRVRTAIAAASSQANQPANDHQSNPQHAEDTQQDEMVIETMQGTLKGKQELTGSINESLYSHSQLQSVQFTSECQLTSPSPESNQCLTTSSSCCKRKVDQMDPYKCLNGASVSHQSSLAQKCENGRHMPQSQPLEKTLHLQGEDGQEQMDETACNMRADDSDYPAAPASECTFDGTCKKYQPPVIAAPLHHHASSSCRATLANDQSYKKSRDVNSEKRTSDVCAKGQSSGKWVKLPKHHTCSVQNEKVDDILYLLHCTVKIVKEIDSSVKLIVVNNAKSLDHESAYQLFQYLRNRLNNPGPSCSKRAVCHSASK